MVAFLFRNHLNAIHCQCEKVVGNFGYHYRDGVAFVFAKTAAKRVGLIIHLFGHSQHPLLRAGTYFITIPQCPGDR